MPLPFLRRKEPMIATALYKTDVTPKDEPSELPDDAAAKEACAQALIDAVHSRSASAVVSAMQDLMDCMSASPESEEPSTEG